MNTKLITDVVVEGAHGWDYPDFTDAYIASAKYDGRPMTDEELEELNEDGAFVNEQALESFH